MKKQVKGAVKGVSKVTAKSAKKQVKGVSTFKGRKATFSVKTVKGVKMFTAVNRRAKTVCVKNGKRTNLSASELKASVGKGSYSFWQYVGVGKSATLQPIKF